jgi:hypothetical protein
MAFPQGRGMTDLVKKSKTFIIRERSNYQLRHFVIGQHDTPEMQYRQILIEARDLIHKIKSTEINNELVQMKIDKLKNKKNQKSTLKAARLELDLEITKNLLVAAYEELDFLIEMSKDYRSYTSNEIESNQKVYWKARLTRQAETDRFALEQGIGVGNLESLIRAGLLQKALDQ